jgi:Tol biopolymer transport system component
MTVPIDRTGTPVGVPSAVSSVPGNIIAGLTVARNGAAVLSLSRHTANLFAVDIQPDGSGAPPVQITFDEVRSTQPRFSREGRLAFNQFTSTGRRAVWTMNDDGSDRQMLTVGLTASINLPQWTPDGTRLFAFASEPERGSSFAFLDVATRHVVPLAMSATGVMNPHLSPDGQEIAFHRIDGNGVINVWRQRLDGGPARQLTFDNEAIGYPAWSHDGRWLAVEIKRGDTTRIGVMSSDGGPVEMLVEEQEQNWPFEWSPDDSTISFAGERAGVWNIYTVSRASKQVRQLTHFTSMSGYVRYPAWSPVRPRIVFERAEHRGSLWTTKLW